MSKLTIRAASAVDEPFRLGLFAEVKAPMFGPLGLPEDQLESLIRMQYQARSADYSKRYPGAQYQILQWDGVDVGASIVNWGDEVRLIDIAIADPFRGQGIGSAYLSGLIKKARETGKQISLYVESFNPAKNLYERFGFTVESQDPLNCLMVWRPDQAVSAG